MESAAESRSEVPEPLQSSALPDREVAVMLLISGGNLAKDVANVREAHRIRPDVRILLIGTTREDGEFLHWVRAGISFGGVCRSLRNLDSRAFRM
jgi:hypothetical protein